MSNNNSDNSGSTEYQLRTSESGNYGFFVDDDDDDVDYFINDDLRRRLREDTDMTHHDKEVIQRLARRSFHIPGNSFWEDWWSFLGNNHPILGFAFAHQNHPFGFQQRLINLAASLSFGLAATSIVVLWYYYHGIDMNEVALTIFGIHLSRGHLMLLVFGSGLHVIFDLSIWYIQACPFCRPNGLLARRLSESHQHFWLFMGSYIAVEITVFSVVIAIYVVLLRASVVEDGSNDDDDAGIQVRKTGIQDYYFVASVFMEFAFTQMIMFPLVAFTLFSGILGCGRIPLIGGRPYQFRKYQQQKLSVDFPNRDVSISDQNSSGPIAGVGA